MIGILGTVLGMAGGIPNFRVVVIVLCAFCAGGVVGNIRATRAAVDRESKAVERVLAVAHEGELERAAVAQAQQGLALTEQRKQTERDLKERHALEMVAEENAHSALEKERAAIARDAAAALKQLAKEKETNDGLRNVAGMLAEDARLCGSAELRLRLDAAAGAAATASAGDRDNAAGDPAAAAAARAAPAAEAGVALTCDQLIRGALQWGIERRELAKQVDEILTWDETVLAKR